MSRITPPPDPANSDPPLTALREPDVSGLALWSALFVASSAVLAFFATAPAQAWPNVQPVSVSAPGGPDPGALLPDAGQVPSPQAQQRETDSDRWH